MIYDFSVQAKQLNGEDSGRTLSDILVEFLGSETGGSVVKLCYWYSVLMTGKSLDIDEPDKDALKELITKTDRLMIFLKVQLLEVLK